MDECIVDVKDQKAQLLKVSLWLLSCRGTKILLRLGLPMRTMKLKENGQTGTLER